VSEPWTDGVAWGWACGCDPPHPWLLPPALFDAIADPTQPGVLAIYPTREAALAAASAARAKAGGGAGTDLATRLWWALTDLWAWQGMCCQELPPDTVAALVRETLADADKVFLPDARAGAAQ